LEKPVFGALHLRQQFAEHEDAFPRAITGVREGIDSALATRRLIRIALIASGKNLLRLRCRRVALAAP
jgi:hypothetical protein